MGKTLARTLDVRLPEALYQQLEQLANATSRTKTLIAVEALSGHVRNESWQIQDIREGITEANAGEFATPAEVNAVFAKYGG